MSRLSVCLVTLLVLCLYVSSSQAFSFGKKKNKASDSSTVAHSSPVQSGKPQLPESHVPPAPKTPQQPPFPRKSAPLPAGKRGNNPIAAGGMMRPDPYQQLPPGAMMPNKPSPSIRHPPPPPPLPPFNGTSDHHTHAMVHILLIGDSLTEGFYNHGQSFHSYGIKLQTMLNNLANLTTQATDIPVSPPPAAHPVNGTQSPPPPPSQPDTKAFLVHVRGVSGETTDRMSQRLSQILHQETFGPQSRTMGRLYDIVCVMGGTNDLASAHSLQDVRRIFSNLEVMYKDVYRHNREATLVAITVPQSFVKDEEYLKRRWALNEMIKGYNGSQASSSVSAWGGNSPLAPGSPFFRQGGLRGSSSSNGKPQRVIRVDLEKAIPYYDANGNKDDKLWDDGLHFTVAGYNKVGEIVYEGIKGTAMSYLARHKDRVAHATLMGAATAATAAAQALKLHKKLPALAQTVNATTSSVAPRTTPPGNGTSPSVVRARRHRNANATVSPAVMPPKPAPAVPAKPAPGVTPSVPINPVPASAIPVTPVVKPATQAATVTPVKVAATQAVQSTASSATTQTTVAAAVPKEVHHGHGEKSHHKHSGEVANGGAGAH